MKNLSNRRKLRLRKAESNSIKRTKKSVGTNIRKQEMKSGIDKEELKKQKLMEKHQQEKITTPKCDELKQIFEREKRNRCCSLSIKIRRCKAIFKRTHMLTPNKRLPSSSTRNIETQKEKISPIVE